MTRVLRVALPVPLPHPFDYLAPPNVEPSSVAAGVRVRVPFGRRELVGLVVEHGEASGDPADLREAIALLDDEPLFTPELLQSLRWAASYYAHPLGEVLATALPVALRRARPRARSAHEWLALTDSGRDAVAQRSAKPGSHAQRVLERLAAGACERRALAAELRGSSAALRKLLGEGLIAASLSRPPPPPGTPHALNDEQRAAIAAVAAQHAQFRAFVLEGVTGSGKTEVYLELIAQALERGTQCLVLVPEIGLTPQALARYRERLQCPVLLLHSGLSDGERAAAWLAAARGEAPVILGTRSAVFTPLACPGLIVVDEEHDTSYKQREGFRYHARDFAVVRARALGIPVVLGSATPSLETLANAREGRYELLRLQRRAGVAQPPSVAMIDLRHQKLFEGLSAPLLDAIGACVARGEQALVFRNRRGFAPLLLCHACGWHAACPRCDTTLTVHRASRELRCHHCTLSRPIPSACPDCSATELLSLGAGTERLEAELTARFPGVAVVRVDRDTTQHKNAFDDVLAGLRRDAPAILVGTQMLAKGHDLPALTLAGIVDVDAGLFAADFRGPERLAQLVIQVAGRAGRGSRPGTVLLQTHHPAHPLLQGLLEGGYRAIAERELAEREALSLPPYSHLALLRAEGARLEDVMAFLSAARERLGEPEGVVSRGPLPAPMARRAGLARAQLLLESPRRAALHAVLVPWVEQIHALPAARRVRWGVDVDPVDLY